MNKIISKEEEKRLQEVQEILKTDVKNLELFKTSLTHRSYLNEHSDKNYSHNERLEFLGDAVLELAISKYLYKKYPNHPEGDLTSFRSAIVRTESLYDEMKRLGLGEYIYMSKGEEQTGGRERPYILANTFEAITGAIYLDRGLTVVEKFLRKELFYKIPNIVKNRLDIDNKSKLQELAQEVLKDTPSYEIIKAEGPDHSKEFTAKVVIDSRDFGEGKGLSKQEAEQNAAGDALEDWKERIENL